MKLVLDSKSMFAAGRGLSCNRHVQGTALAAACTCTCATRQAQTPK